MPVQVDDRLKTAIKLISSTIIVHVVLFVAVFDIYFSSPMEHGMSPIRTTQNPPAKRVVLFVADGLGVQSIFDKNEDQLSFLTDIRRNRGSWGIAHTGVPAESRPGHVALLGGICKDPSAVFEGWKVNPVNLDSVLNESSNSYYWGNPDLLSFNKDKLDHVRMYASNSTKEDFETDEIYLRDVSVFKEVRRFLFNMRKCVKCTNFYAPGNVFMLHLLGFDTAGHDFKPDSKEWRYYIKYVDSFLSMIENAFMMAFEDNETAFIFTAEHGMTNRRSPGPGSNEETLTPIIAWGKGIVKHAFQRDINQTDVAPLISSLIGINTPIHSMGKLPYKYIDTDGDNMAELQIANLLQIMESLNIKKNRVDRKVFLLRSNADYATRELVSTVRHLRELKDKKNFTKLTEEYETIFYRLMEEIDYYHTYYSNILLFVVSVGFTLFIIYLALLNVKSRRTRHRVSNLNKRLFTLCHVLVAYFVKIQGLPTIYNLYLMFPILMTQGLQGKERHLRLVLTAFGKRNWRKSIFLFIVYAIGILSLVHGFFLKHSLTVVFVVMGSWSYYYPGTFRSSKSTTKLYFFLCCIGLGFFVSIADSHTKPNGLLLLFGFAALCLPMNLLIDLSSKHSVYSEIYVLLLRIQRYIFMITGLYAMLVHSGQIPNYAVGRLLCIQNCILTVLAIPLITDIIVIRLTSIFLSMVTFYTVVSTNYELIFIALYVTTLIFWIQMECSEANAKFSMPFWRFGRVQRKFVPLRIFGEDFRRALFCMAFLMMGFFGTGDMASLISLDPTWTECFITTPNPFVMSTLIITKTIIPLFFVACCIRVVNVINRRSVINMLSPLLVISNLMVLRLLYLIKNTGPWLDIEISLSHLIIMETVVVIFLVLYRLAQWATSFCYFNIHFLEY